jgi:hypothetical protein
LQNHDGRGVAKELRIAASSVDRSSSFDITLSDLRPQYRPAACLRKA